VFLQDARGGFYEITKLTGDETDELRFLFGSPARKSPAGFSVKPVSLSSRVAMPAGMAVYPLKLTRSHDGIQESDPVSGEEWGPAGLVSEWSRDTREFTAQYSNGKVKRNFLRMKAPEVLNGVEDAITDLHGNVFWISETLAGGCRIHHENAFHPDIPLNEIIIGEKILKVRGNPSGDGVLVLLDGGQILDVRVPSDFSLQVSKVNSLSEFRAIDLEVAPVGSDPHVFSLVMFGAETVRGKVGLWIKEGSARAKLHPVRMSYVDPFGREIEVPFVRSIHGNAHFTDMRMLLDRHPSELNRFLQYQYEVQEEQIMLLLHRSNGSGVNPADDRNLIGRKAVFDRRKPGFCRYYLLSNFGLSPDLWLN
jgi:hypothetical protein